MLHLLKDPSRNSDKDKMKYIFLSILLIASVSLIGLSENSYAELIESKPTYDKYFLGVDNDQARYKLQTFHEK